MVQLEMRNHGRMAHPQNHHTLFNLATDIIFYIYCWERGITSLAGFDRARFLADLASFADSQK